MVAIEWVAFFVLLVSALSASIAVIWSNALVTKEIRLLKETYRHQKSLELEQAKQPDVDARRNDLEIILARPDGWREVIAQVIIDAFPSQALGDGSGAWITTIDVSAGPATFVVGKQDTGQIFSFTVAPDKVQVKQRRKAQVIPLDAAVSSLARVEVEMVWQHLAKQHDLDTLSEPRQAEWYLVFEEKKE